MLNITSFTELYRKVYRLARPYSRRKPLIVLAMVLAQGLFQVAGVTSVFPFLALAADPEAFRASPLGTSLLGFLPPLSDSQLLILAGIFAIAVLALANLTNFLSDLVRNRYAHGLGHWLRTRLLTEMASKPWAYFLENNTGVLLKKAAFDVMQMIQSVIIPSLEAFARLTTVLFLLIILLLVDFWIAFGVGITLLAFYAIIYRVLQMRRSDASEKMKTANRGAMREAQQLLGGIKQVKVRWAESFFIERFKEHSHKQARVSAILPLYFQTPKYILEPIAFGGIIGAVLLYASLGRSLTEILPSLGVIALAGYRLLPAAQLFYGQFSQISTSRHTVEEVAEEFESALQSNEVNQPLTHQKQTLDWSSEIRLEELSFKYAGASKPVFQNLSLSIPKNSSLGIVGATGSGKSTLVDLILGLHEPSSGRILVDGIPLVSNNIKSWQHGIGYVPQDIFLIDDTIARNIAFGEPEEKIDADRLRNAAEAAQIIELIENELPNGFDTVVGERGVRLSGGQRQRIGLARALYPKPGLLVLDEATSALDTTTEAEVMKAINMQQGSITMIIIAHRLSTVENTTKIINLDTLP